MFNDTDYDLMEEYLCNHTQMMYFESLEFAIIGEDKYFESKYFDFRCHLQRWFNDRIRVQYTIGLAIHDYEGKVIDSRYAPIDMSREGMFANKSIFSADNITFTRNGEYVNDIRLLFDDELNGLKARLNILFNNQTDNVEMY